MSNKPKYGSGEYCPTPSHALPAFVGGKPQGYMCVKCGHLVKDLDPIFDDLCLVCLREWAISMGVSKMVTAQEALEKDALEPTEKIEKTRHEATTVIMNLSTAKNTSLGNNYKRIDRSIPALEKLKKDI
jgi:NMD protein affecting ribosome stability and mRNA decay